MAQGKTGEQVVVVNGTEYVFPEDYSDEAIRHALAKEGVKQTLGAPPPMAQPAPAPQGFDLMGLLKSLPQMQSQAGLGAAKELGRQATNTGNLAEMVAPTGLGGLIGSLPALQRQLGDVPQGAFDPQGQAEQYGATAAKAGTPILASLATAGVAGPAMAGMGTLGKILGTAGLEGLAGAGSGAALGQNIPEQAGLGVLFGGAGAALGAAGEGLRIGVTARNARLARNAGTAEEQINTLLNVLKTHTKEGQLPAKAIIAEGIDTKQPLNAIEAQITGAINDHMAKKAVISSTLPPVPRPKVDTFLDDYIDPITNLIGKAERQVKAGIISPKALEKFDSVRTLVTHPGDMPPLIIDKARGELRILADEFAAGSKKKGVRKVLREAEMALSDLVPELKGENRRVFDLISARNATEDQIKAVSRAGIPPHEAGKVEKLLALLPWVGKKASIARAAGRVLKAVD